MLPARGEIRQLVRELSAAEQRLLEGPVVRAEDYFVLRLRDDNLLDRSSGCLVHPVGKLPSAVALLVLGSLRDRPAVDVDELVHESGSGGPRADDDRRAGAVDVDGRSGERGDCVLVEVAADDDARSGSSEAVQLG